ASLQCMKCPVLLFLRFLYFLLFFVPTSALNSARTASTCASLTPAPIPRNLISLSLSIQLTRNIKRHLPYSTFFLSIFLYPSHSTFSHTPSLCFTPFSLLIQIFHLTSIGPFSHKNFSHVITLGLFT